MELDLVDTHSHILPGIDDGSKSLEQSLDLCRIAQADGIRTIVCTPHIDFQYANRRETIEGPFEHLRAAVVAADLSIELIKGAEVHMSPDILVRLKEKDLLTYGDGGRYLLLEFPFQQVVTGTEEMVYRLRLVGITPVIAHPERIAFFMDDPDRLHRLVRLGALAQITGGSLLGRFGERSQRACLTMIERRLAHIVASDAHDPRHRPPVLAEAGRELTERFGPERAKTMLVDYPLAIVRSEEIEPPEPVEAPRRLRSLLDLFTRRRSI